MITKTDILYFELPFITRELCLDYLNNPKNRANNIEKRIDMLATILALYPYKETSEIARQLGIKEKTLAI